MFGIYNLFDTVCATVPEKIFLVDGENRLSYARVRETTNRLAYGLHELGIRGGSNVGYLLQNGERCIECFFGLQKLGAFMTPFNFRFNTQEIGEYIDMIGCEYFIYGKQFNEQINTLKAARPGVVWIADDDERGEHRLGELMDNDMGHWDFFEDLGPESPAIAILTGGSTGRSKAAVHSKYGMIMQQWTRQTWLFNAARCSTPMVYLLTSPLFHVGGIGPMFNVLAAHGTLIFSGASFNVEKLARTVERERVTDMVLIPPNLAQSIKDCGVDKKYDLSSVVSIGIGGSLITVNHIKTVLEVFPNCACDLLYTQSEYATFISCTIDAQTLEEHPERLSSVGKPVYFTEAKVMRDDGTEAAADEVGELYARCAGIMSGYLNQASPFAEGWLPTGDLFRKDAEGYYYFVDRKKDMIKSGGENVFSAEVENVLKQHPAVSEVAVVGLPDEFFGEAVTAAVVLAPGAHATEAELIDFCRERISSYKKPRRVFFVEAIPKSAIGKTQKARLKELLLGGAAIP